MYFMPRKVWVSIPIIIYFYKIRFMTIITIPDDIDDIEVYLHDVLGYREDEIEFMIKEGKINVKDDRD